MYAIKYLLVKLMKGVALCGETFDSHERTA